VKISIHSIAGHGDYRTEAVYLSVLQKANLGHYMLADTTYSANPPKVSNLNRHTYWWGAFEVPAGDVVVLHTCRGQYSKVPVGGGFVHHFYWGLEKAVWNDSGDVAVLYQIDKWQVKAAK
jgi:hypothetical protein